MLIVKWLELDEIERRRRIEIKVKEKEREEELVSRLVVGVNLEDVGGVVEIWEGIELVNELYIVLRRINIDE